MTTNKTNQKKEEKKRTNLYVIDPEIERSVCIQTLLFSNNLTKLFNDLTNLLFLRSLQTAIEIPLKVLEALWSMLNAWN